MEDSNYSIHLIAVTNVLAEIPEIESLYMIQVILYFTVYYDGVDGE